MHCSSLTNSLRLIQIRGIDQLGGNGQFKAFMKSYPAEGGYTEGMEMNPKYHCWAASQYREKV